MGVDYYKLLQLDRNADHDQLKKEADAKFMLLSQAYHVLIDPKKRAIYDEYGEQGLKKSHNQHEYSKPDDIFREFFRQPSPQPSVQKTRAHHDHVFAQFFGPRSPHPSDKTADDVFTVCFGFGSSSEDEGTEEGSSRGQGSGNPQPKHKATSIENKLPCSLEDLYDGTMKKMKISREIVDMSGRSKRVEEILNINIKPGWKKGTKITFPEKGNKSPHLVPADVVFVIDEKPHGVFTRQGDDLITTKNISLLDALTGYTTNIKMLDGRRLTISFDSIIYPGFEESIPNEGMPIPKDRSKKGNLRIKFNIKFPTTLSVEQKMRLRKLLAP